MKYYRNKNTKNVVKVISPSQKISRLNSHDIHEKYLGRWSYSCTVIGDINKNWEELNKKEAFIEIL